MKDMVLDTFKNFDTNLRLLICATAFGLGVDCPDIERVINWGTLNTLKELVQETGRGGGMEDYFICKENWKRLQQQ